MYIEQYLNRINYVGVLTPTIEVLFNLQKAHLLNIPFENLDIYNKIKIELPDSYNKIVNHKRGGFCYELNSAFYQLLKDLGYKVKMVSARVFDPKKGYGPEFDHMAIIAVIRQDHYLVDVGFGEFTFHPLKFDLQSDLYDPRGIFRIEGIDYNHLVVRKMNSDGEFSPEYLFSTTERQLEEFYDMCIYHQTSDESNFTQNRLCTLPTNEGRITLTGNTFKITENGKITERQLENEFQVKQVLLEYFNFQEDNC